MRTITYILGLTLWSINLGSFAMSSPQSKPSKPNIILILADDMGPGEPSHEGGLIPTPSLDQMAHEGMRFTDAHTSSSVCTPTRYGILTGRYNWRSRLKKSVLFSATSTSLMDPDRLNLPTFLQNQGYHTAMIGKWHLGVDWVTLPTSANPDPEKKNDFHSWDIDYTQPFRNGPVDVGFDNAFFILSSLDMPPYLYLENDQAKSIPTVNKSFPHNEYNQAHRTGAASEDFDASECLATWASTSRQFIQQHAEDSEKDPFFLYLPLTSPHTPVTPGKLFKGKYPQFSWYADFIAETDWVVGQVLEQLQQSGIDDNTLVIFTSDNGFAPYVQIPKMIEAGYRPSGDYRGAKSDIYEGGHRVPFLARWPGHIEPGTSSDVTICTTDFYATFADLLGKRHDIPDAAAEDSFSFYPSLNGQSEPIRPFTIHHSIKGKFAIRKGDWKLIFATDSGGVFGMLWEEPDTPATCIQLYNLKEDPGETKNLEGLHPDIEKELAHDLATALHNGRTTPGEKQKNDGAWPYLDSTTMKKYPLLQTIKEDHK